MDITTAIGGASVRSTRTRVSTLLVAFALLAGSLLLVQQKADAAPAGAAAVVALPGAGAAQIGGDFGELFRSIVCPILLSVRNAFADGPFGGFVTQILNQFLVAFGCAPSG
jgi:hypothetical protein